MIIEPAKLDEMLQPIAKALGLRIKVTYNDSKSASPYSYCIDAALAHPQRATHTIDEEMFVPASRTVTAQGQDLGPAVPSHMVDLMMDIMEDLQGRLHAETRKQMDGVDRRGRIVELRREDKNALHELLWLAEKAIAFHGPNSDSDRRTYERSRAVMEKLFR